MSGSPKSEHLCYVTNSCNTLKEKGHAASMFRLLASIEETSISTYKWAQHFQWKTTHLCKIPEFFYVILTLFREKLVTKAKNTDERPCRLQITLSQAKPIYRPTRQYVGGKIRYHSSQGNKLTEEILKRY